MLKPDPSRNWTLYDLSDRLRMQGWQVPAYPMPVDLTDITVQRIVVRNGLSMDLAGRFVDEIAAQIKHLDSTNIKSSVNKNSVFHH
jgi:glutamate decarboxylase